MLLLRGLAVDDLTWPICSESVSGHGRADQQGRCPWCRRKINSVVGYQPRRWEPSELTEAYGRFYDPDWDALTRDQVRERYQRGDI